MKRISLILGIAIVALFTCSCEKSQLRCNFASADISTTEEEHCILAGFAAREKLSDGIHIPLKTSCLVVTDGNEKICIISNDLMEISPALSSEIRDSISLRSGLAKDHILMHCIHTHSAPRMGGVSVEPGGTNVDYRARTLEAIIGNAVNVITDDAAYVPFHLQVAKGSSPINMNRCEPECGPVDSDLYAVKVISGREPVCAFYNIACHPVCMGHKSLLLSSDYSGVARREIQNDWGCEVFQFTGAAGNMNPQGGCKLADHAEEIGAILAQDLKALKFKNVPAKGILKFDTGVGHLPYVVEEVTKELVHKHADSISVAYKTDFPRFSDDVRRWEKQIMDEWDNPGKNYKSLDFNMAAVNIDDELFFFTQGEPFCEYQMAARAAFPDRDVFFAGYTNGQNSYLPSAHAFEVRKGYEYEIEQMHVYVKSPYPLSSEMPQAYIDAITSTIEKVK